MGSLQASANASWVGVSLLLLLCLPLSSSSYRGTATFSLFISTTDQPLFYVWIFFERNQQEFYRFCINIRETFLCQDDVSYHYLPCTLLLLHSTHLIDVPPPRSNVWQGSIAFTR